MDQLSQTPRYRLLEEAFFAPDLLEKGSIIETWGPPGPHLEPLNESARQTMESWYDEELTYKVKDPTGGEDLVRTYKPHEAYRIAAAGPAAPVHSVTVVAGPPKQNGMDLSLASLNTRQATDQRPAGLAPAPPEHIEVPTGDVAVVKAAKPETTVTTSRRA